MRVKDVLAHKSPGVATVEPLAGSQVHGVLWQVSDHDLATLDSAEGVPVRYRRDRLTVHTAECSVGKRLLERDSERWMGVEWAEQPTRSFQTAVLLLVSNGKGVLAQVAALKPRR